MGQDTGEGKSLFHSSDTLHKYTVSKKVAQPQLIAPVLVVH